MTWIFLAVNALLIFGALISDNIQIGGGNGNTHKNAPLAIEQFFAVMSLFGIIANTSFFNATASRDYTYGMDQIVFASPIKKYDLFFGKFFGAFIIALIPSLGITLAALIVPLTPWADAERFGPFVLQAHLYGFLLFSVFNTFFGGAIIYSFAIYYRNPIIAYLASFGILIAYIISGTLTGDIENESLAMITDPIGLKAFEIYTKYWTPAQKNMGFIGLEGSFLANRAIWAGISTVILVLMYRMFDFTKSRSSGRKKDAKADSSATVYTTIPAVVRERRPLSAWCRQFAFELRSLIRNNSFIILMAIGLVNLTVSLYYSTGTFGTKRLPITYSVVDSIRGAMYLFVLAFMVFYSGYLVFRERDVKFNEIADATPVKSSTVITTKIAAFIASLGIIFLVAIAFGIIYQLMRGYTNLELGVYLESFGIDLVKFSFIIIMCYLLQTLINNKYLAYFAIVVFLIANTFLWQALKTESNMLQFGGLPDITYSDMNGFGPYMPGTVAFSIYWILFCALLVLVIIGMQLRGKEVDFKARAAYLGHYLKGNKALTATLLLLFIAYGGWLYYNISILNHYTSSKDNEQKRISYERKYKKYEQMELPFTTDLDYHINIFPEQRDMNVAINWWVKNVHTSPISEVHYNLPRKATHAKFMIPDSKLVAEDKELRYNRYKLDKPLMPGDSMQLSYTADFINDGIENEVSFSELTQNGSFFHDEDIIPSVGYNKGFEIDDKNDRRKYKLPAKDRMAKLTRNCSNTCNTSYINNSATWVNIRTTISTSGSQTAVAPGTLKKQWKENGRNYFTYQLNHPALNFFAFVSAEYEVMRSKVNGIDIEVYYYKKHPYNVARMTEAVKKSLKYYTEHFGPYYQEQCRIIEYPRYQSYAQAFPGTMPYSEGIGFITDLRDPKSIDMVTYIVAHEMGHQWWAHQVTGPAMQGSEMFSEGLAQYSSLMVMEKAFGREKMNRFLKYELDSYLGSRATESDYENPLMRTEGQPYIHYNKASLIFYYLKEMIGEDKFNGALQNIVKKYAYQQPPFPTAFNVVDEFRAATPDSLKYLITDMFETITLFNNRVDKVTVTPTADKKYRVDLSIICEKLRGDSLGNEKPIALNDYIDIGLFAKNENDADELGKPLVYNRIRLNQKKTNLSFIVDQKPYQAGVDPYHYLIDKVISDNLKKVD